MKIMRGIMPCLAITGMLALTGELTGGGATAGAAAIESSSPETAGVDCDALSTGEDGQDSSDIKRIGE